MRNRFTVRKRWLSAISILIVGVVALFFIQLPYFTMSPGAALPLSPIVSVKGGYQDEKGKLMMTTVRQDRATLFSYLYAQMNPTVDIVPMEAYLSPHENVEDYFKRQEAVMKDSQQTALIVAFKQADLPIDVIDKGVIVTQLIPGMPGEKSLKVGDKIHFVDGEKVTDADRLVKVLQSKIPQGKVRLTVDREGKEMDLTIPFAPFPKAFQPKGEQERKGIGILSPATEREVTPSKRVTFNTEHIGGPSAGLMFTLELINQLTPGDLTKGYAIAGTGTISIDGTVGSIGGISHKVVAAKRDGATIFLAPDQLAPPGEKSNYEEAADANRKFQLGLKIVPVKTIDDALHFLSTLPSK